MTPTIILLSVVTWIPRVNKGDTEKNGFINFNPIPSEIKYFIPGKETVNDIPNLFGSLQKIDLEVVNSYTTDLSGIYNIITVDDKSTWVNDLNVAVVNIVLPWIDFKAAMISSWWSIIVCSAWSACLFMSQNVFLTVFLSSSISFS
jgi:hypothetical protein